MITIKIIESLADPSKQTSYEVDYVPYRRCNQYAPKQMENARVILMGRALSPEIAPYVIPRDGDEIIFVNHNVPAEAVKQAV